MPTQRALKICPDLIMLEHTSGLYGKTSQAMFDLCETVTPLVQRNSVDEGYLDLGPCGFKTTGEIVSRMRSLQERVWAELQIPISIGIASNKLVSQIASKLRKPRGFVVVNPGTEQAFLDPLPVGKIPGVGEKSVESLQKKGIKTIGDILIRNESELHAIFGRGWRSMVATARGEDDGEVHTDHEDAKSYSHQETFGSDVTESVEIERVLKRMIDSLMAKIRDDGKRARTLTLRVRYPDFTEESHGRSLPDASDIEAPFYPLVSPLLKAAWRKHRPLRLVSVRFSGIEDGPPQLKLFARTDDKRRKLAQVMDQLNAKAKTRVLKHGHQLIKPLN